MCSYLFYIDQQQQGEGGAVGDDSMKQQLHFQEIEKLQKEFTTHRCVLDIDIGYVNAVVRECRETNRQRRGVEAWNDEDAVLPDG
jgi:hypothetical protein